MSRIRAAFQAKEKVLIPLLTCGDPDLETTGQIALAMAEAGARLIVLGIPFSDPTAEAPVLQEANRRALAGGITTDQIFELVRRLRTALDLPLIFMTYANVVFSYGTERFLSACAAVGLDGLILSDVPFEEKEEFASVCRSYGVALISLIAPASQERISAIAQAAEGFVYCVSSPDSTMDSSAIAALVRQANPTIPCIIGADSPNPAQAADLSAGFDGILTGSAVVKLAAQYGQLAVEPIRAYISSLVSAVFS